MSTAKTTEQTASNVGPSLQARGEKALPELAPLKVCLLGVTFDSPNLGVGALLYGAVGGILNCYPNAVISVLDYGRQRFRRTLALHGRATSIEFVNMRFSKKFYLRNNIAFLILMAVLNRYLFPKWLQNKIIQGNPILRHLQETDVVASIAGGDSFSDIYGLVRLLYETLPQFLVLLMGKRLVLFPQTLGPFKSWISQRIARSILSGATFVCGRDTMGLESLGGLVDDPSNAKYQFCFDVGFLVEPVRPNGIDLGNLVERRAETPLVGLNVSGLLNSGGYSGSNMFGLKVDYPAMVRRLVEYVISEKGARVLLVPHVHGEPGSSGDLESDERACSQLYEELKAKFPGKLFLVEGIRTTPEIKYVIGCCDLFIGSRMHACIAALSLEVPAIALSYSDKFKGVWQSINMQELVADPRQLDEREIIRIIGEAFEKREQLRQQLRQTIPNVKQQIIVRLQEILAIPVT
jgi:colanic acid/amylovoran biosynthesis protein